MIQLERGQQICTALPLESCSNHKPATGPTRARGWQHLSECMAMAVTVVVTPPVSYTASTWPRRCCAAAAAASPSSDDSDAVSYRSRFSRFLCSCRFCATDETPDLSLIRSCCHRQHVHAPHFVRRRKQCLCSCNPVRVTEHLGSLLDALRPVSLRRLAVHRPDAGQLSTEGVRWTGCKGAAPGTATPICANQHSKPYLRACFLRATLRLWKPVTKSLRWPALTASAAHSSTATCGRPLQRAGLVKVYSGVRSSNSTGSGSLTCALWGRRRPRRPSRLGAAFAHDCWTPPDDHLQLLR